MYHPCPRRRYGSQHGRTANRSPDRKPRPRENALARLPHCGSLPLANRTPKLHAASSTYAAPPLTRNSTLSAEDRPPRTAEDFVDSYREDQHRTLDDALVEGRDTQQVETVVEHTDNEHADNRAEDCSLTSGNRCPTKDHRDNDIELETDPRCGVAGCDTRVDQDPGDTSGETGHHVQDNPGPVDRNTGQFRRFLIATAGDRPPTEHRFPLHNQHRSGDNDEDDHRRGYRTKKARGEVVEFQGHAGHRGAT